MIVHVVSNNAFTSDLINVFTKKTNNENHFFIIVCQKGALFDEKFGKVNTRNVLILCKKENHLFLAAKYMFKARRIIIHGFFLRMDILTLLAIFSSLSTKMAIVFWGADLYGVTLNSKVDKVRHFFKKKILKRCSAIGYLTQRDYMFFVDLYGFEKKAYHMIYSMKYFQIDFTNHMDLILKREYRRSGILKICVGHSCTSALNHLIVYDDLKNNSSIQIHCPLSYGGDGEYRQLVTNVGKQIYGEKFHAIHEFMDSNTYLEFLSKMDVLIIHSKRQIALGNIYSCILLKKNIVLNEDGANYEYLANTLKIKIVRYSEFIANLQNSLFDESILEKNRILLLKELGEDKFNEKWGKLLNG